MHHTYQNTDDTCVKAVNIAKKSGVAFHLQIKK